MIFIRMKLASKKSLLGDRGIALLLVLSSLVVLTTAVVEFAYTEQINYQLAVNAKERLQSYYLARSAVQFSKVMLVVQKQAETEKAKFGDAAKGYTFEPIYKMYPLSSELMKQAISGALNSLLFDDPNAQQEEEVAADETDPETEDRPIGDIMDANIGTSAMVSDEAKEFVNFTGEFVAEISEESSKYDLNKIATMVPTSASYDERKKLLQSLLMHPDYKDHFENQNLDSETLVHALADWVDQNDVINEYENIQRGSEDSLYSQQDYKVKNGKMLTLSEMRLVSGMNDDIFKLLQDKVTTYTGNNKQNLCLGNDSSEAWLRAMIYHYTHHAGCGSPVDYEDEKMNELVELALLSCPEPSAMATAINTELGLVEVSDSVSTGTSSGRSKSGASGSTIPACSFQFKDMMDSSNNVFSIRATGMVGDTQLTINTVVDTTNTDPTRWPHYYYRIE